jgi:hypothetical protein
MSVLSRLWGTKKPKVSYPYGFALKVKNPEAGDSFMQKYIQDMIEDYQRDVVEPARNTINPKPKIRDSNLG